jgi:hypothetical protein
VLIQGGAKAVIVGGAEYVLSLGCIVDGKSRIFIVE